MCNIHGINANYFDIEPIPPEGSNTIRINLNNNGVNFFGFLDWSTIDADLIENVGNKTIYNYPVDVTFINAFNNLSLDITLTFKLVKGEKYKNLPTKNNLEIQAELLANKIVDIIIEEKESINKFSFDIDVLKREMTQTLENLNITTSNIDELFSLISEVLKNNSEEFKFQNDKISVIMESNHEIFDATYSVIADYFKKEINNDIENKANIYNSNLIDQSSIFSNTLKTQLFDDYSIKRNDLFQQKHFENITTAVDKMFLNFRDVVYSDIVSTANQKFLGISSKLNSIIDQTSDNATEISLNRVYVLNNQENIKTIVNKLSVISSKHLEDLGTTSGWKFTGNALYYNNRTLLTSDTSSSTLSGSSNVYLKANGNQLSYDGDTLSLDGSNTTVDADYFTGTANKAKYADVAEYYSILPIHKQDTKPGNILYISTSDEENSPELTVLNDGPFAGIITTNPGFILNSTYENRDDYVAIALTGRVPIIISNYEDAKRGMYIYIDSNNPNVGFCTFEKDDQKIQIGLVISKIEPELNEDKTYIYKVLAKV